jgi:hypothetical protein
LSVEYFVAAQAIERDGKRYALVEIIDENTSGPCEQPPNTRVRINPAGKLRALASLMGTPLMGPPAVGHAAERIVGSAADWSSNGATKVLYEIPDPADWERMRSGEWGPVSPEMMPTKAHYEGDTYVLDDWAWNRVAFVPRGAFPNAGVKSTCIDDPRLCGFTSQNPCGFYRAVAAALNPAPRQYNSMQATIGDLVGQPLGVWHPAKVYGQAGATAWDTADAPDDCFAVVPDAARGPRGDKSLRKLPLVSVEKKEFDAAIVKNALTAFHKDADSLLSGTGVAKNDALGKICSAAREVGIDSPLCVGMEWSRTVNVPPGRAIASVFSRFDPMRPTIGDLVGSKPVEAAASGPPVLRRVDGRFDSMQVTVGDLTGLNPVRGHTSGRTIDAEPDDFLVHPRRIRD